MNQEEIRFHLRGRWKAVEEIERQELRAMSLEEHWQKLNAIVRFAKLLQFGVLEWGLVFLLNQMKVNLKFSCVGQN